RITPDRNETRARLTLRHRHLRSQQRQDPLHDFGGTMRPLTRLLAQQFAHELPHGQWHRARQRRRRLRDLHQQDRADLVARKRRPTAQHFVHEHAERVDVSPIVDLLARGLLGRHVLWGTKHGARLRNRTVRMTAITQAHLRDPEVEYFDDLRFTLSLDEHYVVGLEVAMYDVVLVRGLECLGDLSGN